MPKPRKSSKEKPCRTLRIFCEGEKTEPSYFRGYLQDFFPNNRTTVIEIQKTRKNTPVQLVDEAVSLKNSKFSLPDDEFWVVYDRESVAKYSRELHAKAWEKANKAKVNVALSNVCFEYWLLLHLVNSSASYTSCDDLLKNSPLKEKISSLFNFEYEKSSAKVYQSLRGAIPKARKSAEAINQRGRDSSAPNALPFDINPFTEVHKLLDAIDAFK